MKDSKINKTKFQNKDKNKINSNIFKSNHKTIQI